MSKRSASLHGSAQHRSPEVRRTPNNRKCVVVEQKMVKSRETVATETDKEASVSPVQDSLLEDNSEEDHMFDRSTDKSPSGSVRSSGSSFLGGQYVGFDGSSESKILDELKTDIEFTAAQVAKLELEVGSIPVLKKKLQDAEKEKKMVLDNFSEKCEIVETMKQRLSVLHEQNNQLALLAQKSSDSSETTLRMRNALVASLAQLKKLQGVVDEVPELKSQITALKQENLKLKQHEQAILACYSVNLPEGIMPLDYTSLQEENEKLRRSNESLKNGSVQLSKSVELLSDSLEDVKKRVRNFETSSSNSLPLSNHIKKLEKDKEDLYDELVQFKLAKSISYDVDVVYLDNECIRLRKVNSVLQNKFNELSLQFKQQKERIVTKLFEIEVSNLKSRKYEVVKHLSDMDVHKSAVGVPGNEDVLPPQFKAQILKLHQFQLQSEQSHQVFQLILSEKTDLERNLAELKKKIEAKSIAEFETKINSYESKLAISHAKITDLERKLQLSSQMVSTDHSSLLMENVMLKSQLSVHSSDNIVLTVTQLKKQLSEEQHLHEICLQKYRKLKEQNQKLETKLKEKNSRFQSLASELSNSVQLMKKYQIQCVDFEKEVEAVRAEREAFRKANSSLIAELEVIKAEYVQNNSGLECLQPFRSEADSSLESLSKENLALKQRILEEDIQTREKMELKNCELQSMAEKLEQANKHVLVIKESFAVQQEKCSISLQDANVRIKQLETERLKNEEDETAAKQRIGELNDEISAVSAKFDDSLCTNSDLRTKLKAVEKECQGYMDDSESRVSHMLKEIDACQSEKVKLLVAIAGSDASIHDLTNNLLQKESEIMEYKEKIQALHQEDNDMKYTQLHDKLEGYNAMIRSLQRQLDEAETREVEHEALKQKMHLLERSLRDPSHDSESVHETVQEIPLSQAEHSLQERNLQLEEQVSVLSQWNDKQQQQIEQLERTVDDSARSYAALLTEVNGKDDILEANFQLKRELKEVEIELNSLRRQVKADMQEELQMKLEAKTQLLAVFNQHNALLQQQVCFYL